MATKVNPDALLFTQDSIKNTFKQPREHERIDDAVDSLLRGSTRASDFPRLSVVSYEGRLWSLDNRRLWVFKKALVPSITVQLVPHDRHPRFKELIHFRQELKTRILRPGYWPRVRGPCRERFRRVVARCHSFDPIPVEVQHTPMQRLDTIVNITPSAFPSDVSRKRKEFVGNTGPLPSQKFPQPPTEKWQRVDRDAFAITENDRTVSSPDTLVNILPDESYGEDTRPEETHPTLGVSVPDPIVDNVLSDDAFPREFEELERDDSAVSAPEAVVIIHIDHPTVIAPELEAAVKILPDASFGHGQDRGEEHVTVSISSAGENTLEGAPYGQDRQGDQPPVGIRETVVNIPHDESHGEVGAVEHPTVYNPGAAAHANTLQDWSYGQVDRAEETLIGSYSSDEKSIPYAYFDFDAGQHPPTKPRRSFENDSSSSESIWGKIKSGVASLIKRVKNVVQRGVASLIKRVKNVVQRGVASLIKRVKNVVQRGAASLIKRVKNVVQPWKFLPDSLWTMFK